jgi:signal peptidase II
MASIGAGPGWGISLTDAALLPQPKVQPAVLVAIIATALALDQLTKWLIVAVVMQPPRVIQVVPGFNLTLGFNEGSSFGMLSGVMAGRPQLMAALTGLLTVILTVMAFRARRPFEKAGLALIVGGALGNIVDRLRQGAVTDFLDLYWRDWHWPTFNGADIAITLGALCVLVASLPPRRRKEPALDQP